MTTDVCTAACPDLQTSSEDMAILMGEFDLTELTQVCRLLP